MRNNGQGVDYSAALTFLRAADKFWKVKPLVALEQARPAIAAWLSCAGFVRHYAHLSEEVARSLRSLRLISEPRPGVTALRRDRSQQAREAHQALKHWARAIGFAEPPIWLLEIGVWTVFEAELGYPWRWCYELPNELRFLPRIPGWDPGRETELQFRARARSDFERELAYYLRRFKQAYGLSWRECVPRQQNIARDAEWLARYVDGARLLGLNGEVDDSTIRRAIRRFAARLGFDPVVLRRQRQQLLGAGFGGCAGR